MSVKETDNAKNFSIATVSTGYNAAVTTIVLATGEGANLPSDGPFDTVWWDSSTYASPSSDPNREIISVPKGGITADTLTGVTRGAQGTTAATHNTAGKTYKMVCGPTAKHAEKVKICTADGTAINNSTTLIADPDLKFDIGANETWIFEIGIFWISATANLKLDLSGPAAPTNVIYGITGFGPATGTTSKSFSGGSINDFNSGDATNGQNTIIHGTVINGANAGTVQLRLAQQAAVAEDTKRQAGSWLKARRVA